ncbi:hypothetical protein ACLMJK_006726 [Lecanora helva]
MADAAPEVIYGAAGVGGLSTEDLSQKLKILQKHNVKALDTAFTYPESEAALGKQGAPHHFVIHTKAPALKRGIMAKKSVLDGMEKSLKDLNVETVELYYLHGPDPATPIEETLSAIQEIYAAAKFKRFGVSNFSLREVQQIYDIQLRANSVLPSVYQGNYNAVARHIEADLFPLLRKLQISFYAYSPIAGGFLVKESAQVRSRDIEGRFNGKSPVGDMYNVLYGKESMYQALDEWGEIAKGAGISKASLAYRWITYHSALDKKYGDGLIIGAGKNSQLEETLTLIEAGPLDVKTAGQAGAIWEKVRDDAPRDNWSDYLVQKV